jgi:Cu+-exporting ATPase
VRQVVSLIPGNEKELLSLAASLEKSSEHLIGKAIYEYGLLEKVLLVKNDNFISVPGEGVLGEVAGDKIFVGKKNFLTQHNITIPESLNSIEQDFLNKKESVIFIGKNHEAIGLISLADRVKESAKEGIQAIKNLGIKPMMVTGDNEVVAHHIGGMVGIENIVANAMPGDKVGCIDGLQSQGEVVAMVGDGINDAPALTSADLSIGIGAGTDIALAASDITLVGSSLMAVAEAIMLSRKTLSVIKSNLIWAFGYNIVAIPLAMLQIINPLVSAGLMSFSSIFVVLNALRLKSFHLEKESHE